MRKFLPRIFIYSLAFILGALFALGTPSTQAATSGHLVISEIQVSTTSADFIELYNPTASSINLGPFRLVDRNSVASTDASIVAFTSSDIIPANGYFLWCNTSLISTFNCDRNTGVNLSNNNSIGLRNGALTTGTLIDAVTVGLPAHSLGEGTPLTFSATQSFERKAISTSTSLSMAIDGSDEFTGNGEDTDNNFSDFITRNIPQPQSSDSVAEGITPTMTPTGTPVPTNSPTPIPPTNTPIPTATSTPTSTPTPTATDTPTPTPTPTQSPTNTPTSTLTPTPTISPSNTPAPTLTSAPIATVTPTLSPSPFPLPKIPSFQVVCINKFIDVHILSVSLHIPYPMCSVIQKI